MAGDEAVLALLSALAEIERQLINKELSLARADHGRTFRSVAVVETKAAAMPPNPPPGLYVGVRIVIGLSHVHNDGTEAIWSSTTNNRRDGSGWVVDRDVVLNESDIGEPVELAATWLQTRTFFDAEALAVSLPALIEELLSTPVPLPVS